MGQTGLQDGAIRAQARSALYGLLACAFAYPEPVHRSEMAELDAALAELPNGLSAEARALAADLPDGVTLEDAFIRIFTHSLSKDCPPFETSYTATDIFQQTQQMADIAGFYRAFGVEVTPGTERVDHICAELEFMQLLTAKEAYARLHLGAPRVGQGRRAQRLFVRDHLGCWAPAFGRRLAALDPTGWYGRAGVLLAAWMEQECRTLTATPAVPATAPTLAWPEPDDGGCGPTNEPVGTAAGSCADGALPPSPPRAHPEARVRTEGDCLGSHERHADAASPRGGTGAALPIVQR